MRKRKGIAAVAGDKFARNKSASAKRINFPTTRHGIRLYASLRLQPRVRQLFDLVLLEIRVQLDLRPSNSRVFPSRGVDVV